MAPQVGIIGTGNVALTIGKQLAKTGRSIVYGSRNPSQKQQDVSAAEVLPIQEAVSKADVLVLAVPGELLHALETYLSTILIIPSDTALGNMRKQVCCFLHSVIHAVLLRCCLFKQVGGMLRVLLPLLPAWALLSRAKWL